MSGYKRLSHQIISPVQCWYFFNLHVALFCIPYLFSILLNTSWRTFLLTRCWALYSGSSLDDKRESVAIVQNGGAISKLIWMKPVLRAMSRRAVYWAIPVAYTILIHRGRIPSMCYSGTATCTSTTPKYVSRHIIWDHNISRMFCINCTVVPWTVSNLQRWSLFCLNVVVGSIYI